MRISSEFFWRNSNLERAFLPNDQLILAAKKSRIKRWLIDLKKLSISKQYKDKYEIWMNAIYHGGEVIVPL